MRDDNGDGAIDGATGTASGSWMRAFGDVFDQTSHTSTMTASRDTTLTTASLFVPRSPAKLLPFEAVTVRFQEPLREADVRTFLRVRANGVSLAGTLTVTPIGGLVTAATFQPKAFLGFNAAVTIGLTGLRDPAGNALSPSSASVSVVPNPGALTGNAGFESGLTGWIALGQASALGAFQGFAPPQGAAQAVVREGSTLAGVLDVPAGATELRALGRGAERDRSGQSQPHDRDRAAQGRRRADRDLRRRGCRESVPALSDVHPIWPVRGSAEPYHRPHAASRPARLPHRGRPVVLLHRRELLRRPGRRHPDPLTAPAISVAGGPGQALAAGDTLCAMLDTKTHLQQVARLRAGWLSALLISALAGCGSSSEQSPPQEPAAQNPSPVVTGDSPTAAPEGDPAAAPEGDPAAAPEGDPEIAAKPTAVAELGGRFGFDGLHPESTKCRKLDRAFVAKLEKAQATCQEQAPGESFGVDGGPWHSCVAGDQEWMIFATKKICVEMFETMMANAG